MPRRGARAPHPAVRARRALALQRLLEPRVRERLVAAPRLLLPADDHDRLRDRAERVLHAGRRARCPVDNRHPVRRRHPLPRPPGARPAAGPPGGRAPIPLRMGVAEVAGIPPVAGLYSCVLPLLAYALFGSSRQLVIALDAPTAARVGPRGAPP